MRDLGFAGVQEQIIAADLHDLAGVLQRECVLNEEYTALNVRFDEIPSTHDACNGRSMRFSIFDFVGELTGASRDTVVGRGRYARRGGRRRRVIGGPGLCSGGGSRGRGRARRVTFRRCHRCRARCKRDSIDGSLCKPAEEIDPSQLLLLRLCCNVVSAVGRYEVNCIRF